MEKLVDPVTGSETILSDEASGRRGHTARVKGVESANTRRFRDINEDDDGYHPFSDGPDLGMQCEEDPWR